MKGTEEKASLVKDAELSARVWKPGAVHASSSHLSDGSIEALRMGQLKAQDHIVWYLGVRSNVGLRSYKDVAYVASSFQPRPLSVYPVHVIILGVVFWHQPSRRFVN